MKIWISDPTRKHNLCRSISSTLSATVYLSIHSHFPVCDSISRVNKRCFVAHCVGILQNVKALSILTELLQGSSGGFTR